MTGENRFYRSMHIRDAIRRQWLAENASAALAEDAQQRGESDDPDLDEQNDGLGVIHCQDGTR